MVSYICSQMILGDGSVIRPSEEPNEVRRGLQDYVIFI